MNAQQPAGLAAARRARQAEERRVRGLIRSEHQTQYRENKMGHPGPTPQTRKKLTPHAIETLQDRGIIDQSQASMLEQIARAYSAITCGTGPRISKWERVDGGRMAADMMPSETRLLQHYARWWEALKEAAIPRAMPVVVDVAVEGLSLNEIARNRRMDKRRAKRLLLEGLDAWHAAGRRRRINRAS